MIQKVIKVGTSAAVIIPKRALMELGLKIGDEIKVDVDKKSKSLTVEQSVKVDDEIINWTKKFIETYRPALEALSDK